MSHEIASSRPRPPGAGPVSQGVTECHIIDDPDVEFRVVPVYYVDAPEAARALSEALAEEPDLLEEVLEFLWRDPRPGADQARALKYYLFVPAESAEVWAKDEVVRLRVRSPDERRSVAWGRSLRKDLAMFRGCHQSVVAPRNHGRRSLVRDRPI